MDIEVSGIKDTSVFLKTKLGLINKNQKIALNKAAIFLQGEVKESIAGRRSEPTSVDTGRFLNSIDLNIGNDDAVIFTGVSYSKFLEYGTSKIKARKHFQNTKDRNQYKVINMVEEEIKKV